MEIDRDTINRLAESAAGKILDLSNGKEAVLLPRGDGSYSLEHIEPLDRPLPSTINQIVRFDNAASLMDYVNDFKRPLTRLFVSRVSDYGRAGPSAVAYLDYHDAANGAPHHVAHKAIYTMPWSEQWKRWTKAANEAMSQPKMLEFLEENGEDITAPMAAELIDAVGRLSNRKKVEFKSSFRLSDGSCELSYAEEAETSGGIKVAVMPTEMKIGIPVFADGPGYEIRVFIRHRINDGKLTFHLVLHRSQFAVEEALKEAIAEIEKGVAITAHWGTAE